MPTASETVLVDDRKRTVRVHRLQYHDHVVIRLIILPNDQNDNKQKTIVSNDT